MAQRFASIAGVVLGSLLLTTAAPAQDPDSPPPSPARSEPDPLGKALSAYESFLGKELGPSFRKYEEILERPGVLKVMRPLSTRFDEVVDLGALSAMPAAWIQVLNTRGDALSGDGESAPAGEPSPPEFQKYESRYVDKEPAGDPVPSLEVLRRELPEKATAPQPAFGALKDMLKTQPVDAPEVQSAMTVLRDAMKLRIRVLQVEALKSLREGIERMSAELAARPEPKEAPWKKLQSPGLRERIGHYLAERYFKGKWTRGKTGARNTPSGKEPPAATEGDSPDGGASPASGPPPDVEITVPAGDSTPGGGKSRKSTP